MGVEPKIGGKPPKSSILIGFSIINHPFWGSPIFGNTQIFGIRISEYKTIGSRFCLWKTCAFVFDHPFWGLIWSSTFGNKLIGYLLPETFVWMAGQSDLNQWATKNNTCFIIGRNTFHRRRSFYIHHIIILLTSEILHHLGCIKPCKEWDKLPINWMFEFFPCMKIWKSIQWFTTCFITSGVRKLFTFTTSDSLNRTLQRSCQPPNSSELSQSRDQPLQGSGWIWKLVRSNWTHHPCEIWKIWWIIEMPQGTWFLDGLEWRNRVLQQNSGMLFTNLFFQDQNRLEGMVWLIHPDYPNITSKTHLANGPWKKNFERLIFPTKYGIPKSSSLVSHWLSKKKTFKRYRKSMDLPSIDPLCEVKTDHQTMKPSMSGL